MKSQFNERFFKSKIKKLEQENEKLKEENKNLYDLTNKLFLGVPIKLLINFLDSKFIIKNEKSI